MKHLFQSFSYLYEPGVVFSLLTGLSAQLKNTHNSTIKQNTVSSLLFEEDRSNSFMEPVQLTQYIREALQRLVSKLDHSHPLVKQVNSTVSYSLLEGYDVSPYFY